MAQEQKLKPIILDSRVEEDVKDEILSFLYKIIFEPVINKIKEDSQIYFNSVEDLAMAIKAGKIFYSNGAFYGSFASKISKELIALGANYNKRTEGFMININSLPTQILSAIAQSKISFEMIQKGVLSQIDNLNFSNQLDQLDFTSSYNKAIKNIDGQFDEKLIVS
jgi:hypothetical protein